MSKKQPLLVNRSIDTTDDYTGETNSNNNGYAAISVNDNNYKEVTNEDLEQDKKNKILGICLFLMLTIGTLNRIFSKLLTIPLYNYPIDVNIVLCVVYILFYACYIFPTLYWGDAISVEERQISPWTFAIMGSLDAIASLMQSFSFTYITSGALLVLLMQAAIPISMLVTKLWLKTKYKAYHYIGATTVIVGLIVVLLPQFLNPDSNDGGSSASTQLIWCSILVASCFPMAISAVYKEKTLAAYNMNGLYLNGWISVFQLFFTLIFSIPSVYTQANLTISELPSNILNGFKCMGGVNSLPSDDCSLGPFYYFTYLAFNIVYNIVIVFMLKYGSSNILYLAMTAIVPLVDVAFSLDFMPKYQPFTVYSIVGLVVILVGLCVYRFTSYILDFFNVKTIENDNEN